MHAGSHGNAATIGTRTAAASPDGAGAGRARLEMNGPSAYARDLRRLRRPSKDVSRKMREPRSPHGREGRLRGQRSGAASRRRPSRRRPSPVRAARPWPRAPRRPREAGEVCRDGIRRRAGLWVRVLASSKLVLVDRARRRTPRRRSRRRAGRRRRRGDSASPLEPTVGTSPSVRVWSRRNHPGRGRDQDGGLRGHHPAPPRRVHRHPGVHLHPAHPLYVAAALARRWAPGGDACGDPGRLLRPRAPRWLLVLAVPAAVIGSYVVAIHAFSRRWSAVLLVAVAAVRTWGGKRRVAAPGGDGGGVGRGGRVRGPLRCSAPSSARRSGASNPSPVRCDAGPLRFPRRPSGGSLARRHSRRSTRRRRPRPPAGRPKKQSRVHVRPIPGQSARCTRRAGLSARRRGPPREAVAVSVTTKCRTRGRRR